jgi:geranylgeranylglycerol-phosphate geranylgeranyltransferase
MFASMPMLAYGIKLYDFVIFKIILFSIISLYSGFFAALIWNDITDKDIDSIAHPDRPLPSGRISSKKFFTIALIFSAMTFLFAYLVSFWCLCLVGVTALFVAFHDKYLKKIVKFPAYSEIFTPVQWIIVPIFGFLALWTMYPPIGEITLHFPIFQDFFGHISLNNSDLYTMILLVLFTYFADNAHDLAEGIHDIEGDQKSGVRTYAISFGEKNAARISFSMFFLSGILGFLLYIRIPVLTPIFLVFFVIIWLYTLRYYVKLLKADENERKTHGEIAGRKGFNYFLLTFDIIFLDIFIQLLMFHFNY